jgi:cell division protein FtsL
MSALAAPTTWVGRPGGSARRTAAGLQARLGHRERHLVRRLALAAALVLAFCLALVWVRLQVVRTGYDLGTARRLERRLEQEQRALEIELATLTSQQSLEVLARQRLGMGPQQSSQVLHDGR